jgi:hypothetical protein
MTTIIQPGGMTVVDYSVDPPVIVFDSNEKLLAGTEPGTGWLVGSVTLPARTARIEEGDSNRRTNVNVDNYHAVAAINVNADIVLGCFRVTTFGGTQGIAAIPGIFDAGGTYIHTQEGGSLFSNPGVPTYEHIAAMAAYTFIASGGVLYLSERAFISCSSNTLGLTITRTLLSIRFDFKIYVGTLT